MREATSSARARSLLALTAADLMTRPVLTLSPDTCLREAARKLSQASISGAPVLDTDGRCVGVLSSSDFVTWACNGAETATTSFIAPWGELINVDIESDSAIRNYMTLQPVMVTPETAIGELARIMVDAHIHRVLVVADPKGGPCGIVTSTDLLAAIGRAARERGEKASHPRAAAVKPR
jgi:CBS domain-containing protein